MTPSVHALIVHFDYGSTELDDLFELQEQLSAAVDAAGVGEVDGHEIALDGSDGFYYLYGPSADALFNAVWPILSTTDKVRQPVVTLRYGEASDPSAVERVIDLSAAVGKGTQ
jgi:hypothetical protein